jgi:hypothetical protein
VVHPALSWGLGLSWASLLPSLRLPGEDVGVVPWLAAVEAHSRECSGRLPRRRSGRSLPLSWWSRRRWKPLALSRLLLRLRMRWKLLPLLVLLGRPLLLLLRWMLIAGTSVAAQKGWSHLPLLILNLLALTLGVEGSINQLVEVVEAVV